jgi:hypothetical protein
MSIQIVEITQPSVIDTVAVAQPSTVALVEIRQGPAGDAGGGSNNITSATTSDGTADLDLLNVDTVTATVSGTLTADHIHGNLAGNVYGHIRAGETLAKGDPVYVSGSHGSGSTLIPIVSKADASNAAKMPAVGIMDAAVANNANGHMVIIGTITELNTAAYSVNAELYVASGGGFTATPPTARAQPVARVERANANNGAVIVKVNGLSASDATGNTLVRRDAIGGASFVGLNTSTLDSSGITTTGQVEFNGTDAGDSLTFNMVNYFYGTGAASAHRIALGAGTTGAALFGAATAAAANTALNISETAGVGPVTASTQNVDTNVGSSISVAAGTYHIEINATFSNASTSTAEFRLGFGSNPFTANPQRFGAATTNESSGTALYGNSSTGVGFVGASTAATTKCSVWSSGILTFSGSNSIQLRVRNTAIGGTVTCDAYRMTVRKLA